MKIGIFDSGLGGLSILRAIRRHLPQYDYLYYGDTAHLPYGDKSEAEIQTLTAGAIRELFLQDASLIIVACNTASAETLRVLQDTMLVGEHAHKRILGVIIPTVEDLIISDSKHALLIGTTRTIDSKKYPLELVKHGGSNHMLRTLATPGLVPFIEERDFEGACIYFENVVTPKIGEADTLILGCTHYTVLKDWLRMRFPYLRILSQDEIIPLKVESYLRHHPEIKDGLTRNSTCTYRITGDQINYIKSVREYATS